MSTPGGCWKLKRSIYGLKQAAWCWYTHLQTELEKSGFRATSAPCIFVTEGRAIASHVDDMINLAKTKVLRDRTKSDLSKSLKLHNLGDISFDLGMKFTRDRARCTIEIAQDRYLRDILERHKMLNVRPFSVPMRVSLRLEKCSHPSNLATLHEYQKMIGSLMYAVTSTRPDLAYMACYLSQFSNAPGPEHLDAMKYAFHYLAGTADLALVFDCSKPLKLVGYVDSDWAGDRSTLYYRL